MQKCATIGYRIELTITEYSLTTSTKVNHKKSRRKQICTWYYVCVVTPSDTNVNVTTKKQNPFNTAHMNTDT